MGVDGVLMDRLLSARHRCGHQGNSSEQHRQKSWPSGSFLLVGGKKQGSCIVPRTLTSFTGGQGISGDVLLNRMGGETIEKNVVFEQDLEEEKEAV